LANGERVAHLADYTQCEQPIELDVLAEGAATVYVEQLPMSAVGHATIHGGTVVGAVSPNVFVGGATFAIPSEISIEGPPEFQNKVLRDMWLLWCMPSGKALFAKIVRNGKKITIVPFDEPGNSFAVPRANGDAVVHYNPELRIWVYGMDRNTIISCPPPVALAHELIHAEHFGSGTDADGPDPLLPAPPDPEHPDQHHPGEEREETKTIGVGSYRNEYPSENSFRRDLGLPERGDHAGHVTKYPGPPMRPGKYW